MFNVQKNKEKSFTITTTRVTLRTDDKNTATKSKYSKVLFYGFDRDWSIKVDPVELFSAHATIVYDILRLHFRVIITSDTDYLYYYEYLVIGSLYLFIFR